MIGRTVLLWWVISWRVLPIASEEDNGGRVLPLLGDGGSLPLEEINARFRDSYILQARNGDLPSAVEGFDALVRSRRGTPYVETSAGTSRNEIIVTGGGGDDHGVSGVAMDALEVFVERYEGVVREFTARAATNFDYANREAMPVSTKWVADTFDPYGRGNNFITALHKLDHDREQLEYLIARKRLPQEFERLAKEYGEVREIVAAGVAEATSNREQVPGRGFRGVLYGFGSVIFGRLRGTYNSFIYVPPEPAEGGLGGSHPTGFRRALNPNLDWNAIEEEYLSQELPLLWFDGFLSPEALEGVLDFCREATVFFHIKLGYLGAYFNDGLTSPWLVQIAHELQERLPRVLAGMTLSNLWAYKFDSDTSMDGIAVHADHAAVNLNFWITPDEANLDPSSGGLVVYPKAPPTDAEVPGGSTRKQGCHLRLSAAAQVGSVPFQGGLRKSQDKPHFSLQPCRTHRSAAKFRAHGNDYGSIHHVTWPVLTSLHVCGVAVPSFYQGGKYCP